MSKKTEREQPAPETSDQGPGSENAENPTVATPDISILPLAENTESPQPEQSAGSSQEQVNSGNDQARDQHETPPVDEEAPFGRRADGSPAAKRGPKAKGVSDESDKQRNRLRSVTPSKAREQKPKPIEVTPLAVVNYQAMGESVASMWFHGGEMVFGAEWAPDTHSGEHLAVAGAFRDYFKATNMRDLPPGFALCFVLSVYTLKRANKPTVKTRLQGWGLWLKTNLRFKR